MKNITLLKITTCFFALIAFAACDKFEEDTRPILSSKLTLQNDYYTTIVNQSIELKVLANDSINNQATVTFGNPNHGKLQATGTPGTVFYQPDHNSIGTDSVSYEVCIGGSCVSAMVEIKVLTNNPCSVSVNDDTISVFTKGQSLINILQNDVACNNQPIIVKAGQYGNTSLNANNQLVYWPHDSTFIGTDEVRYSLGTLTGKVTIRLKKAPVNCTLRANADTLNLPHATWADTVYVLANDTWCQSGSPVSINLVNQSMYGTPRVVQHSTGPVIFYYLNNTVQNVTDQFQYRLCQGGNCTTTTVTVNIQ